MRTPPAQLHGEVPPSFRVTPDGVAGRPADIPLRPAPDGSFVRAEPGVYARRDTRGLLQPGARVVSPDGVVLPPGSELATVPAPDPSFVRAERGEYAAREPRALLPERAASGHEFVAGPEGVARRGDIPTGRVTLDEFDYSGLAPAPQGPVSGKGRKTKPAGNAIPAAVADRQLGGSPIYSSDPSATSIRGVPLDDAERLEVRTMLAEMEAIGFTKHTFNEIPRGAGGGMEIVGGAAGAPVYQHVIDLHGGSPGRAPIAEGMRKLIAGEATAYGPAIREAARRRLHGHLRRTLPPDAGVRLGEQSGRMDDADFDRFGATLDDLSALGPTGEPGELGAISPFLVARMGGGAAGATYGAATGEDTQDRLTRAAVFGGLGVSVPGLLRPRSGFSLGAAARLVEDTPRPASSRGTVPDIPTTARPAPAPGHPMRDPMAGVDVFLRRFAPPFRAGLREVIERNQGFQAQRRGVVQQGDVDKMAEAIATDVHRRVKPGTALSAEAIRAHVDALAGAQAKVTELSAHITRGDNADGTVLALEVAKAELSTIAASIMGARSEAGRALAQFKMMARVLETRNPELIGDAARVLRGDAERFAREFGQQANDPVTRFRWLQQQDRPGLREKARQLYLSNILSGVKTHERNFLGNTANLLTNLAVAPASAAADAVRAPLRGGPRTVYPR